MVMDILLVVLSFLCIVIGIIGCLVPILPGASFAYIGLLLLHFTEKVHFSYFQLIIWLLLVVVLQILDYVTPILGSKYSGGTTYGKRGCLAGTFAGMFFMPWGILVGPFVGAVVGELLGGSNWCCAFRSGIGSLLGFVLGTLIKVLVCVYFLVQAILVCI